MRLINPFFQNYIPEELPIPAAVPIPTGTHHPVVTQPLQEVIAQNDLENSILAINNEESESDQSSDSDESENQEFPGHGPNGPAGRRHIRQHEISGEISLLRISIHSREEEIYQ